MINIEIFRNLNPVIQALIAGIFTWGVTAAGSAIVLCFKQVNKNVMDALLGFAAGVMVAASFWSLLSPGIDLANKLGLVSWLVVFLGFISGGIFLLIGDRTYDYFSSLTLEKNSKKRSLMLLSSITLHNIPEGLAVGVAFGSVAMGVGNDLASAMALAFGIGLQNFPEGSAISLPLRREGYSRSKSFFLGQISGIVEPVAALFGAWLVMEVQQMLPFLLAFAAGAMIYVVVLELIPESQTNKKHDLIAFCTMLGFSFMMILDVALG